MDNTENLDALDDLGLIATRAFIAVDRKIRNAVKSDEMLAICGEPGMGKTTAGSISIGRLKESRGYTVLTITAKGRFSNSAASLECFMIEKLSGERPRRNQYAREDQLKLALLETSQQSKIVLAVEEAHNLDIDTVYGIKKLHEIGRTFRRESLFSVIFFGQPQFNRLIRANELRLRIESFKMQPLNHAEARDLFRLRGLKGLSETSAARITQNFGFTPLALVHACRVLKGISGDGRVTDTTVNNYLGGILVTLFKHSGYSYSKLSDDMYSKTGIRRDKSTYHKIINGTLDVADDFKRELENLLVEATEGKTLKTSAAKRAS